jgi:TatA/E family protein of Tat protein translocase
MQVGFTELLLILAVAALMFGGRRIALLGSELGKSAGDLKRGLEKRATEQEQKPVWVETKVESEIAHEERASRHD